ncbi:Sperm flagellar protein 1 [Coccomyxa sp. Obi]|nr:Sperm flagellar protein 1 [Coccomyxa sp. Obi]
MDVDEEEMYSIYLWVDEIPLSRPKRNIARDFADGVLVAELVHHYFPRLVELHNYSGAHGLAQKMYNWCTLNQKVFKRLGFVVAKSECQACASCQPGAIERVLKLIRLRLSRFAEGPGLLLTGSTAHSNDIQSQCEFVEDFDEAKEESAAQQCGEPHLNGGSKAGEPPAGPVDEALAEKDSMIMKLTAANEMLEAKIQKLEQLLSLKDKKIDKLAEKLSNAGIS